MSVQPVYFRETPWGRDLELQTAGARAPRHGLCEVLKVKGRADCASQGHATKGRGRRSVADWYLASGLFLVSAARAVVLLEALLGNAVKCERRNGALQARGVKPQLQWEQHQPVNVSSSIQIMCLFIGCAQFWISTEGWTSARGEKSRR